MGKRYKRYDDIYVVGSNAVKVERYYNIEERNTKRKGYRNHKKTIKNVHRVNSLYTLVLVSVIMATLLSCIMLMKAQFTVKESAIIAKNLQKELNDMKKITSEIEASNNEALDLKHIYDIATTELGMVLPENNKVYYVNVKPVSYTKQYSEIIIHEESNTSVVNVLGMITKGW